MSSHFYTYINFNKRKGKYPRGICKEKIDVMQVTNIFCSLEGGNE